MDNLRIAQFFGAVTLFINFLINLIPFVLRWVPVGSTRISPAQVLSFLNSDELRVATFLSLGISIPSIIMHILKFRICSKIDIASTVTSKRNSASSLLSTLLLVIPDLFIVLYAIPQSDVFAYHLISRLRLTLLIWMMFSLVHGHKKKIFLSHGWIAVIICYSASKVLLFYYEYFGDESVQILPALSTTFHGISLLIYAIITVKWLIPVRHQIKDSSLTDDHMTWCNYSIALLFCWVGVTVINLKYPDFPLWYDLSLWQLAAQTMMFTIYYLIIMVSESLSLESNMLRAQVLQYIYILYICFLNCFFLTHIFQNELETKSMFIRYISHEIRNPLSSVQLGLDALEENMISNGDGGFLLEILHEAKAALQLSIVTVNDMLTSNKIRSGFLMLEKKKVSLLHWLIPVVKGLQLQVILSTILFNAISNNYLSSRLLKMVLS